MKKLQTDLDYVCFYAKQIKENNELFKQHKKLINSQLKGSLSLFRNSFGKGKMFKINARKYLRGIGLLK